MKQVLFILAIVVAGWSSSFATGVPDDRTEQDSLILFRFVPGKLMFYSPFAGNEESIQQVVQLIERHRGEIERGEAFVRVMGYCCSFEDKAANLQAAKNRSNQVKSYFITHHGMKEDYYRTGNRTSAFEGMRDVVAVVGLVYAPGCSPAEKAAKAKAEAEKAAKEAAAREAAERAAREAAEREAAERAAAEKARQEAEQKTPVVTPVPVAEPEPGRLAIKTNLLYDLLLLPTLEMEYRFNDKWSLNLEGSLAWWRIGGGVNKYYDLWIISPEARYWFKTKAPWHGHHAGFFVGGGRILHDGTGLRFHVPREGVQEPAPGGQHRHRLPVHGTREIPAHRRALRLPGNGPHELLRAAESQVFAGMDTKLVEERR